MKYLFALFIFTFACISSTNAFKNYQHFKENQFISKYKPNEKCYGSILDAGSSSTKVSVYSWICRDIASLPKLDP